MFLKTNQISSAIISIFYRQKIFGIAKVMIFSKFIAMPNLIHNA